METIQHISGHASRKSVFDAIQRLKSAKYVRQLQPKDYQETKTGWKSNRYQVLWLGDEPKPTYEDIQLERESCSLRVMMSPHIKKLGVRGWMLI
jgi:hypothetical protein